MKELISFKNSFKQDFKQQEAGENDALASITIDGFPVDEDGEGSVVAVVLLTKHGDIVVDWHENAYRMDTTVLNLIKESKEQLKKEYRESKEVIKVQAVWEFEADVADYDPKFVDLQGLAIDSTQRELVDLLEKKELSAEDFTYKIVD